MTREKIAIILKNRIGLSKTLCEELVDLIILHMIEIIKFDNKLIVQNFGSFSIKRKKERPGQNLQTGKQIVIPERTIVRFTPAQQLKSKVNKQNV